MEGSVGGAGGIGANMLNCLSGGSKCSTSEGGGINMMSTIADPRMGKRLTSGQNPQIEAFLRPDVRLQDPVAYVKWLRSFL